MKKNILSYLLIGLLLSGVSVNVAADRYSVEQYLTDLAQITLNSMFGEGNFVARVQVRMTDSKYEVKYTEEANPKKSSTKSEKEVYILPGIPALKNISPESLNQLPYNSITTLAQSRVDRMSVYILGDKKYPRSQARKAEAVVKKVLNFREGIDVWDMEYKVFYKNPELQTQTIQMVPGPENYYSIENIMKYSIAVLLLIAIFVYVMFQRKMLSASATKESGGPNISVNPNLELPDGMEGAGGSDSKITMDQLNIKRYFDFVSYDNIEDFIYLVNSQSLKPEYISLITSFLPSNLSAKLIKALPEKVQSKVATDLIEQRLGSRTLLDKLEKKLKTDMECFVGGEDKFVRIFDNIASDNKKSIINKVKKENPKQYKKMRPHILLFDDIILLSDEEVQHVVSDVDLDTLAIALVHSDKKIKEFIMKNLTKSANDIVSQYLQLKSNETTKSNSEKAEEILLKIIKRLESKGTINIVNKIKKL
ncbi:hypothetical protein DID76_04005 [Candidatus Marinamargulisbacteria bacterium SCGC AG-414-C22]|nr:hypothetical protein DID76_04005 [Candidatus Marinamargulisbacteria bacterium SCGC AG-414-C22]